jgi:hypothetical protein
MAYMSQEKKAKLAPAVKAALKKYNLKGTLSVNNHSTLVLKIKQGPIDFIKNFNDTIAALPGYDGHKAQSAERTYIDVNPYHFQSHFTGKALAAVKAVYDAMMVGNHDRSDMMTDYFDVGWYVDINIGSWNAPYALVK